MYQIPYPSSLADRLIGASRLDIRTYQQIALDTKSTIPAALIVGGTALSAAIGNVSQFSWVFLALFIALTGWMVTSGVGTHLVTAITQPNARRSRFAAFLASLEDGQKRTLGLAAVGVALIVLAGNSADGSGFNSAALLLPVASWSAYTFACYLRARKTNTSPDVFAIARATGFAHAPGLLALFGFIPLLGMFVALIVPIWVAFTLTFAIRHTLGLGLSEAFRTMLLGTAFTTVAALVLVISS